MKKLLFLVGLSCVCTINAQTQIKAVQSQSFVEMQSQFEAFRNTHDLEKEKGWKYYKRWEQEALMHTMPNGELADPALVNAAYIEAVKQNQMTANKGLSIGNWIPEGPYSVEPQFQLSNYGIGRINCIAYHPNNPSIYWVGVAQGGVWKTIDNGLTWTPLTDQLPILRISDIAVNPNNVNEIYISVGDYAYLDAGLKLDGRKRNTHYGLGVYKTLDGGVTWQATGLSFSQNASDASLTRKVVIHPTFNNRLVAATTNGMYKSNDAGATWTQILDSLFWDLVQDPSIPNTLYAATGFLKNANTGYASVMKSTDFGATWVQLPTTIPPLNAVTRIKLCVVPGNSNIVYALAVNLTRGMYGLYKSSNAGTSWIKKFDAINLLDFYDGSGVGGQGTYDLVLMAPPQDTSKVYAGGINIWGSEDGGSTFEPVTNKYISSAPDIHVDQHFLSYNPITQNVFICNDGGIYRSPLLYNTTIANLNNNIPFPTIWSNISAGLQVTAFYRMSSDRSASNLMIAGAQDNSTYLYDGTNWNNISGGDGMDNYIENSTDYISSSQFGNFGVQTSSGGTGFNIPGSEWTAPLSVDYSNLPFGNTQLYFGGTDVYESTDFGFTRNQISNFDILSGNGLNEPPITSIAAAGSRLYVTKRPLYPLNIDGYCYTSANAGGTWQNVTAGLPDSLYFTSAEVNPDFPLEAYVTCAGFSTGNKVFKTVNGGQTWTNVSFNLPNLPMNMIKCIDGPNRLMILASDIGVYYLKNNSSTWQLYNAGLPNVIVSDIELNTSANKILVSTFGRGIWSTSYSQFMNTVSSLSAFESNTFGIYPNPVQDILYLKFENAVKVVLTDLTGKVIKVFEIEQGKIQLKDIASGLYIISVFDKAENTIFSHKLIKQ